MGLAVMKSPSPLRLHIRCENCLRESSTVMEVPPDAYVPNDMYELAQQGYLDNIPFFCAHCESSIGKLFAISGGRVE